MRWQLKMAIEPKAPCEPGDCEDAVFVDSDKGCGVADGVGGWIDYGVNSALYSNGLLKAVSSILAETAETAGSADQADPMDPVVLIDRAHAAVVAGGQVEAGSSTCCVALFARDGRSLKYANIGDSRLVLIRQGAVVGQSRDQQLYPGAPFQIGIPKPGLETILRTDASHADSGEFQTLAGDVLVMGTDGLFDNVSMSTLLELVAAHLSSSQDPVETMAGHLARVAKQGYKWDDIALVVGLLRPEAPVP